MANGGPSGKSTILRTADVVTLKSSYKRLEMSTQTARALHPKIAASRNSRYRVALAPTPVNPGLTASGRLPHAVSGPPFLLFKICAA
jgi:hypothetical protein